MKPRDFVINSNNRLHSCSYTVIPVINNQILDLPYHIKRLKQGLELGSREDLGEGSGSVLGERLDLLDNQIDRSREEIASACWKSLKYDNVSNGLLTVCVGLKKLDTHPNLSPNLNPKPDPSYQVAVEADSHFYPMNKTFLFSSSPNPSPNTTPIEAALVVDLQCYTRLDPRVKASSWPIGRAHLEAKRLKEASETIMYSIANPNLNPDRSLREDGLVDGRMYLTEGKGYFRSLSLSLSLFQA
jgi:hypothetical protein